jgi:hypothetical protein
MFLPLARATGSVSFHLRQFAARFRESPGLAAAWESINLPAMSNVGIPQHDEDIVLLDRYSSPSGRPGRGVMPVEEALIQAAKIRASGLSVRLSVSEPLSNTTRHSIDLVRDGLSRDWRSLVRFSRYCVAIQIS